MMKISNRIQNHKQYQNISQYIFYRIVIMLTIEANMFHFALRKVYSSFCSFCIKDILTIIAVLSSYTQKELGFMCES
jgi:hypothetical protein